MPTTQERKAPLNQRLDMALEDLFVAVDGGREFPDAAFSVAQAWGVPQKKLEAAYDAAEAQNPDAPFRF